MATNNRSWKFNGQHWKISAVLYTGSPLHIGNGANITHDALQETLADGEKRPIDINACVKDGNGKPYIPGSTIKGKLCAWLDERIGDDQQRKDWAELFGIGKEQHKEWARLFDAETTPDKAKGLGGRAEFHNALLVAESELAEAAHFPYWRKSTQTYVEVSTAVNRVTGSVAERKLFHTELVPPGIGFQVTITGLMSDGQAALLVSALQAFGQPEQAPSLGAEDSAGKGRMALPGAVNVARMDAAQAAAWLNDPQDMAENAMQALPDEEVKALAARQADRFSAAKQKTMLRLDIQMDGPFLINNPTAVAESDAETDHRPLLDGQGKPLLSGKSLRGALRSQAERIIRSLGGHCCDTSNPCKAIYHQREADGLCLACQAFGATGWQSPLHIGDFKCTGQRLPSNSEEDFLQQFVAIDRFHGGGKHNALYNATYSLQPKFTGHLAMDERFPAWGKGLLALLLRDLNEGDITLGFGANKGYGGVAGATVFPQQAFTAADLKAFRDKCKAQQQPGGYPCLETATPQAPSHGNRNGHNRNTARANANPFLNPYQFIPVIAPDKNAWLENETLNPGAHHHSHAVYREGLYHGRLHCTLVAETPFFVGAKRDNSNPAKVDNYKFDEKLAIPATSLRGLLSSLAEAASNSALRVLDNSLLSYRKQIDAKQAKDRPLSALGLVVERDGGFNLIPLALPTLEKQGNKYIVPPEFRTMFPDGSAALKVYLENAYGNGPMANFLRDKSTWSPTEHNEIYYLPLGSASLTIRNGELDCADPDLLRHPSKKITPNGRPERVPNDEFVIGQKSTRRNETPSCQYQKGYTPGILRILGKYDREKDLPNKKHELFIPVPQEFVDNFEQFVQQAKSFPISTEVLQRFEGLADQRSDSQKTKAERVRITDNERLPYNLKGQARRSDHRLRLKHGDLVYFRPDADNPGTVAEIAFSALWRGRVETTEIKAAKVFDFFPAELLPFNPDRTHISPAELLFGFAEDQKNHPDPERALSFAGKVRVGTGTLVGMHKIEPLGKPVTLKILAAPKLPSPAMYFQAENGAPRYIAKRELNPQDYRANGRKQYLHAKRNGKDVQKLTKNGEAADNAGAWYPWVSHPDHREDNLEQKVEITPIKKGTAFEFDVGFSNLTEWELGLLCYALRPTENYRHKLGMGKPIGLGSVAISIESLQLIDRQRRYRDEAHDARQRYHIEFVKADIEALRDIFTDTMYADIRRAIELLGDPAKVGHPVHYPQVQNADIEDETYRWFVNNDKIPQQQAQSLAPLDANTPQLPPLKR